MPAPIPSLGPADLGVRDLLVDLWTSFLEAREPSPPGAAISWEQYTAASPRYLDIRSTPAMEAGGDWQARTDFWDALFPRKV